MHDTDTIGASITEASSEPFYDLGLIICAKAPKRGSGEFIYLKGAASTSLGSVVTYNPHDFSTALVTASSLGEVAVAMAATCAGQFGWYQLMGKAVVRCGTVAGRQQVFATSTPGRVDGAATNANLVRNARFVSATGAAGNGLARCEIWWPYMEERTAV